MPRRKLGDDFLACRTYNHAWDKFNPIDLEAPWYGWRLSLRCLRCGTERHDNIAYGTGEVMGRRYIYAEGYQYQGEDTPKKEQFREELFTKLRSELKATQFGTEEKPPNNIRSIKSAKKNPARKSA
jgi:hypothetical protein